MELALETKPFSKLRLFLNNSELSGSWMELAFELGPWSGSGLSASDGISSSISAPASESASLYLSSTDTEYSGLAGVELAESELSSEEQAVSGSGGQLALETVLLERSPDAAGQWRLGLAMGSPSSSELPPDEAGIIYSEG